MTTNFRLVEMLRSMATECHESERALFVEAADALESARAEIARLQQELEKLKCDYLVLSTKHNNRWPGVASIMADYKVIAEQRDEWLVRFEEAEVRAEVAEARVSQLEAEKERP
jgi:Xaa-Pro aminopeptidase